MLAEVDHPRVLRFAAAFSLIVVAAGTGCADDDRFPGPRPGGTQAKAGPGAAVPCTDGATRSCKVFIGEHDGVRTCFQGTQVCEDAAWGICGDPDFDKPLPLDEADAGADASAQDEDFEP
jgi:hypothetical protein